MTVSAFAVAAVVVAVVVAAVGGAFDVGVAASFGSCSSTDRKYLAAVGSGCLCFSVGSATCAVAVGSNRTEVLGLDSASGDWACSHRPCIALQVLHHCCLADSDMVVVQQEKPTSKKK